MPVFNHNNTGWRLSPARLWLVVSVWLLALLLWPAWAAEPPLPAAPASLRIVAYNLRNYLDPNESFAEAKSEAGRQACAETIAGLRPDIALFSELGGKHALADLLARLAKLGLDYPFSTVVEGPDRVRRLAIVAKFPAAAVDHQSYSTYNLADQRVPVQRGFANCLFKWDNGYQLRLLGAHLKSKRFHPLGQTDMRRYEARQLRYLVDKYVVADPTANLLLLGDLNDAPNSSPLNTLFSRRRRPDGQLYDLRPADPNGQVWTHFWNDEDSYSRIDYALASQALLPEVVLAETRLAFWPEWFAISDHRPVIVTIVPQDQPLSQSLLDAFPRNMRAATDSH